MKILRTPESRFSNLADFAFRPHYLTIDSGQGSDLRIHYVDEGPAEAPAILLMHGEPTWSYLYRHMIPILAQQGHRVIAPDLVGFGRSDKPAERGDYTYARHVAWMRAFLEALNPAALTLVCQDWGGLIGLRLWAAMPDRFAGVVVANTALPTGDDPMGAAFESWRAFSQTVDPFNAGRIVHGGTVSKLSASEVDAYNAPFPDASYQAGARQFPMLVPTRPDDPESDANRAAWRVIEGLHTPVLTAFGAEDKVMAGIDRVFQTRCRGAAGQRHHVFDGAGHFLQEDVGPDLARLVLSFVARSGD